jgi:hypothetical protein
LLSLGSSSARQRGQYLQRSSSGTVGNNRAVHQEPEPTPEEHDDAPDRQHEAEEQRGAPPAEPKLPAEAPDEPIHDA